MYKKNQVRMEVLETVSRRGDITLHLNILFIRSEYCKSLQYTPTA